MSLCHCQQQQNKQWLVPTAAACGCCWCIRTGLSPGWCLGPPCSTTARSPHPLHCPRWQKSSIKCTSSSPTAASCPYSPPATATQTDYERKQWDHSFFMPSFAAGMPLFCSSLTNFLVATMTKSANRNISALRQDVYQPMPPTLLTP